MPHLTNQNPTAHALPMIDSPCCCCGTGLDLPLFLEFMRYTTLLYLDADAISREPSLDAINSRLEIGQRRAQTTFIIISLGVLQIVKTLGKIVQLSNFILLVHFLHITGWLFFLTEIFSMLFVWNAFIRRELVINYDTKGKILQTYTISMSIALYQLINDF